MESVFPVMESVAANDTGLPAADVPEAGNMMPPRARSASEAIAMHVAVVRVMVKAARRHQGEIEFEGTGCTGADSSRHGHGMTAAVPRDGTGASAGAAQVRGVHRLPEERPRRPTLRRGFGKSRRPRQPVRRVGCQSVPPTRSRRDRPAGGILCSGAAGSARANADAHGKPPLRRHRPMDTQPESLLGMHHPLPREDGAFFDGSRKAFGFVSFAGAEAASKKARFPGRDMPLTASASAINSSS